MSAIDETTEAASPPRAAQADAGIRAGLAAGGLVALVAAAGFCFRWGWATDLWPWDDSRLSYIFIGSILAAIGVPLLWIALSGELAAVAAGGLDLAVMYGGMTVYVLLLLGDPGQPALGAHAAVFAVAAAASLAAFAWGSRRPVVDKRPMPRPVRVSFAILAAILIPAGTGLVLQKHVFPWPLRDESSVMFGLVFLGAAVYFLHGVARPSRANAIGQLAGFLAYDIVLIGPFLDHFGKAEGGDRVSLIIYTTVVVYSGALAVYYLFVDKGTRLRR